RLHELLRGPAPRRRPDTRRRARWSEGGARGTRVVTEGLPGPGDDLASKAASVVRTKTDLRPHVAIVLGSGLGAAIRDWVASAASFSFDELPGFPPAGVPGHAGRLSLGSIGAA